ncbi:MAG: hypothetical protein O3A48_02705 [Actinomycetota bacterium]|nr:hypothetical protein [Actinomycetota bacterium]MDA3013429.1 hypothetical protein [Actinomycetota bacterium]
MEEKDTFVDAVESLIETLKKLIIKPVKRVTGFASMGILLIVLLLLALVFLLIGVVKLIQGFGLLLGIDPTGFAFATLGLVFLVLALKSFRRKK